MTVRREIEIRVKFFGAREYVYPQKRLSGRRQWRYTVSTAQDIRDRRVSMVRSVFLLSRFILSGVAREVKTGVDSTLRTGADMKREEEEEGNGRHHHTHRPIVLVSHCSPGSFSSYAVP